MDAGRRVNGNATTCSKAVVFAIGRAADHRRVMSVGAGTRAGKRVGIAVNLHSEEGRKKEEKLVHHLGREG